MSADDRHNASINYSTSLRSLQGFLKKDDLLFSDITSFSLNLWIDSLSKTRRAKSMYPNCIKAIYNNGLLEYNDYDNGTIRIKHDPFRIVKIPKMMPGKKKSIAPDVIAEIFAYSGVYSKPTLGPLSKDVVTLSFFLAGMNAADLYSMDKSCLKGNKLYYNRKKTSTVRDDNAYMEIEIPDEVLPLLKKYKGKDRVFSFYEMYYDLDSFNKYINKGLKDICGHLGIDNVTTYTFRHSWATIAQNDCGASTELVGFCLNHASAHKITEGYIKKDYSKVDILNRKVIDIVKAKMPNFAAGHSLE